MIDLIKKYLGLALFVAVIGGIISAIVGPIIGQVTTMTGLTFLGTLIAGVLLTYVVINSNFEMLKFVEIALLLIFVAEL